MTRPLRHDRWQEWEALEDERELQAFVDEVLDELSQVASECRNYVFLQGIEGGLQ